MPKKSEQDRKWLLIDLDGAVLGRAATRIANLLRGKHKPTFTPHLDMGDFVVAINAEKIRLTGKKLTDKIYYRHSGYPGGIKARNAGEILEKKPSELIRLAVSGMLPKNRTRKHLLTKLRIYAGAEHPHAAQQPTAIGLNDKEVTAQVSPKQAAPKTEAKPAKASVPKTEAKAAEKKVVEKPAKKAAPKAAKKTEEKPLKTAASTSKTKAKPTPKNTKTGTAKATNKKSKADS